MRGTKLVEEIDKPRGLRAGRRIIELKQAYQSTSLLSLACVRPPHPSHPPSLPPLRPSNPIQLLMGGGVPVALSRSTRSPPRHRRASRAAVRSPQASCIRSHSFVSPCPLRTPSYQRVQPHARQWRDSRISANGCAIAWQSRRQQLVKARRRLPTTIRYARGPEEQQHDGAEAE